MRAYGHMVIHKTVRQFCLRMPDASKCPHNMKQCHMTHVKQPSGLLVFFLLNDLCTLNHAMKLRNWGIKPSHWKDGMPLLDSAHFKLEAKDLDFFFTILFCSQDMGKKTFRIRDLGKFKTIWSSHDYITKPPECSALGVRSSLTNCHLQLLFVTAVTWVRGPCLVHRIRQTGKFLKKRNDDGQTSGIKFWLKG